MPEKITLFAKKRGDTFTWQPPANTNGKLTGFDFRIFYKGKEDEAVVVELDVLDFCYSPLTNEIPSGSGDLCVQVKEIQLYLVDSLLRLPSYQLNVSKNLLHRVKIGDGLP